jgi:hypothetical protein
MREPLRLVVEPGPGGERDALGARQRARHPPSTTRVWPVT